MDVIDLSGVKNLVKSSQRRAMTRAEIKFEALKGNNLGGRLKVIRYVQSSY